MAVPDSFDQPISDWDSSLYGNNVYMDQSVGFDNDSGSTLTTDAIADCDPIGIQNAGKIRKRMVPCGEKAPSVEPQNIPEAEPVQAGITDKRPPQIPPGILRYHPDKVPTRDKTHKIPDFWNLPVLAPDSSSSCPGIQEGADMEALYYVCDSGFDLDVIVNLLFGYTILQNASLGISQRFLNRLAVTLMILNVRSSLWEAASSLVLLAILWTSQGTLSSISLVKGGHCR